MRIVSVETCGVGGLADGKLELPEHPVVALAGGNGTGKSKLLACILALWTGRLPGSPDSASQVVIEVALSEPERTQLLGDAQSLGQPVDTIPERFPVTLTWDPLVGLSRSVPTGNYFLANLWNVWPQILQLRPSLDVVYLPAERRLVGNAGNAIDLNQLSDAMAQAVLAAPRDAVQQYGRLDDAEFENYARALCVASTLRDDPDSAGGDEGRDAEARWLAFRDTVNTVLEPKVLLDLTRQNPDKLLVRTPSGEKHSVADLSSGERQALIIISRVLRAGAERTLVLIDEPDAYLHPHLSRRLITALEQGVGTDGQLIVATHSPAILDSLPVEAIVRLGHGTAPRLIVDEQSRVELYRDAGFRASAVTQADLLVAVEGVGDSPLLQLLIPELGRAAIVEAGGRSRVVERVDSLHQFALPVLGLVDGDVDAPATPSHLRDLVSVLPVADLEAAFLSDGQALDTLVDRGIAKQGLTVDDLRSILDGLLDGARDNVIAEIAQRSLRSAPQWPTPRGDKALERLRDAVAAHVPVDVTTLEAAIAAATARWDALVGDQRWTVVRGKHILGKFVGQATVLQRDARSALDMVARARPPLVALDEFRTRVMSAFTP